MSLTDVNIHNPKNFTIISSKKSRYLYNASDVFNDDSDIPMQKYLFLITGIKVLNNHGNILNVTFTTNNPTNQKIYYFVTELEKNIGRKLGINICQSNFRQCNSTVTICLYARNMIIFNEENIEQKIKHIEAGNMVSLIIKLSQVVCEEKVFIPIWKVIQGKIHRNMEKICMFEQPKNIKPPVSPPPMPVDQKHIQQESSDKHKNTQQQSFVPSVGDIMSIKNKLRKVIPEKIHKVNTVQDTEVKKKDHNKDSNNPLKNKVETNKKMKK